MENEILDHKTIPEVFFIRGHAKSGTNWLCKLVNLHPGVSAIGEFHFENLFEGLHNTFSSPWGLLKAEAELVNLRFYKMVEDLIIDLCGRNQLCGDRTPGGITESYIPGKKCLYITRDGRDVLVSWTFHAFRLALHTSPEYIVKQKLFDENPDHFESFKKHLLDSKSYVQGFAKAWNDFIVRDLHQMKMAEEGILDLKYYHIKYEQLHADPDVYRDKIYQFLGLDPAKAAPIHGMTAPGFNRIDNLSLNRRGQAGGWRDYLTQQQEWWFEEEASEALEKLGHK